MLREVWTRNKNVGSERINLPVHYWPLLRDIADAAR